MVSRVLVAMDGSEVAETALEYALDAFPAASITVLTVVGEPSAMFGEATAIALSEHPEESMAEYAAPVVERAREIAADHDAEIDLQIGSGHPARVILDVADDYDTVVVGSHGGSLTDRLFVGNVAEKVVRRSPVPVTVVR
ncbi:universal stress protein [Salinirubrum litoreum]|uniref:Universal stress protein n=1 Tax=Salinirubrum litoreum TaxID=1126234 RepID=A0ABD5RFB9_9EURY|nr:universal stress protein [Salinirubrum litoreum]